MVDGTVEEVKEESKQKENIPQKGMEVRVEYGTARQALKQLDDFTIDEGKTLLRVDLACGQKKKEGYKGFDRVSTDGVDIVHDLMQFPWPLEDESVYEFFCAHYVEHIPIVLSDGLFGLNRFMEEVYRCLMPNGTIEIHAPYYMSQEAYQDPTHTRCITDRTFMYYNQNIVEGALDHYMPKCNFLIISQTRIIDPAYEMKGEQARRWAMDHYWNIVKEYRVTLRKMPLKIKEGV